MSLSNRLSFFFAVPALVFLVACGSSSNRPVPPPTGGFSNSNLNGTYVFSSSGADTNGGFITFVGTLTANGSGSITGGTVDVNGIDVGLSSAVPVTSGSYSVSPDGRGHVTLKAITSVDNTSSFDFVLTSSSHGLISEFDGDGSGSGTLDLQSTITQAQLTGKYVFNLSGTTSGGAPFATVGLVNLDSSGNLTGTQDLNNSGSASTISLGVGSNVLVGAPGTAKLGTFTFDVYPIDATHLKFIETDIQGFLTGDAFSQTDASFPTGQIVFTMAGVDFGIPPTPLPLAVGGLMTSDGTSAITNGVEDFNDAWNIDTTDGMTITPVSFGGSFVSSGARFFLTLNNFENGEGGQLDTFTFAAYPSSGGVQLLEIDGGGVTGGVAYAQTNTSFASGQGYGLNLSGANANGFEEDDIAEFANTSNTLKGLFDANDMGQAGSPQNFNATYAPDSSNPGRGLITSSLVNLVSYTADNNNTIFIEIDAGAQLGLGSIGLQNSGSQAALRARMAALNPKAALKAQRKPFKLHRK